VLCVAASVLVSSLDSRVGSPSTSEVQNVIGLIKDEKHKYKINPTLGTRAMKGPHWSRRGHDRHP
jgi:hypothetical protein